MPVDITDIQTDVTNYEVLLAGETMATSDGLLSVVIEKIINRIASAQLVFTDSYAGDDAFPLSNRDSLKPGTEVEIKAGYHDETETVFKGIITRQQLKIKDTRSLLMVECKDKAIQLSLVKKSAYYIDMKDSDAWDSLVSEAGLTLEAEATTTTHKQLVQYNSSAWDFIVTRAEMNGMMVSTVDGTIRVKKPSPDAVATVTGTYGQNLYEFEASMDARTQIKNVKCFSWNDANQELSEAESEEPSFATNGNVTGEDLAAAVKAETYNIWHSGFLDDTELKAVADSKLIKSRLGRMQGRMKLQGNSGVNPGDLVAIEGVGDRYKGNVFATAVRHEIARGQWHTDIQFGSHPNWFATEMEVNEPAAAAMLPAIQGLQVAVVTDLEDPEGASRVKVKVPVIDMNEEGIWARQATLDAGNARGVNIRPEIGDEVIVGFINGDPRHAVILGALHSSKNAAPIEAKNDNHEKGWVTRSGMKLILNDDEKSIHIETPGGNKIFVTEKDQKISIIDQSGNKVETSPDGIQVESAKDIILKATGDIKMEGINIEAKASAGFKAEGGGQASLKSSGTTSVQGSLVQLN